jgi:hypothetical protein
LVILEIMSHFCPGWHGPQSFYFIFQVYATTPSFYCWDGGQSHKLFFCLNWPRTMILPSSQIARNIGVSHQCLACPKLLVTHCLYQSDFSNI